MINLQTEFDAILNNFDTELKNHWLNHLHFSAHMPCEEIIP